MEMKRNVGAADRYVRFMIGLAFIMLIFTIEPTRFGTFVLLALGAIVWNTVYTGYCFFYDILGITTTGEAKKPEEPAEQTPAH